MPMPPNDARLRNTAAEVAKLNRVIGTIGEKIEISKAKIGNDHQEMVEMLRMLVPR